MVEASLRQLRETADREMYPLYESVIRALDSLLRATCPPESQPSGSPKSLLAMCLRRIPDYIAELEYWEKKDAEVNKTKSVIQESKVSFDIYTELESMGALAGWKHLRIVARAHGIKIIRDALRDGLAEDRVAPTLIGLCCMYLPFVESQELIDVYISRQYPPPDPSVRDGLTAKSPALYPLWAFGFGNGSTKRYMIGKLADLFGDGSLPAEWMLVDDAFKSTRFDAIAKMHYGPGQDCVDFMVSMANVLSTLMPARRQKRSSASAFYSYLNREPQQLAAGLLCGTMASLAATVLSYLNDPNSEPPAPTPSRRELFVHRVRYIFRTYLLHAKKTTGLPSRAVYIISLCDFLAFGTESSASTIASAAWKGATSGQRVDHLREQYLDTLSVLSIMVYTYSGAKGSTSGHAYIHEVCYRLIGLLQNPDNFPYRRFQDIDLDLAFTLAFGTNDLQDLAYAEKLWANRKSVPCPYDWIRSERNRGEQERIHATEELDDRSCAGFKWDETLSEWVTEESPEPPVGAGGGRTTRQSTRCLATTGAAQPYPSPTAATPATTARGSPSAARTNRRQMRGTRLLRSNSASTTTTPAADDDDDALEENEDGDNISETGSTSSQTDVQDDDSESDWDSDLETSNVVGPNETYHQQIPPPRSSPRKTQPRFQAQLQLQQQQTQRRQLSSNKRKLRPVDTDEEDEGTDEDEQESDSDEDDDDDDDNVARRPVAKRLRTRASLAAATATATSSATASGSGTSGRSTLARRRSVRRSTGSNGSGSSRVVHEDTSEDELG